MCTASSVWIWPGYKYFERKESRRRKKRVRADLRNELGRAGPGNETERTKQ